MPEYQLNHMVVDIARDALLLDTNVLVAAFNPSEDDGNKDNAKYILDEHEQQLLVPTVVVVEAWGFLVGRSRNWSAGFEMFTWLNSPGRATIVPANQNELDKTQRLMSALSLDCVDAMLAELATNITQSCGLTPPLTIATFDTRDFLKMTKNYGLELAIFDMRTFETLILP